MSSDRAPGERRAASRTVAVLDALEGLLSGPPLDVLDIGGGTGGLAVRFAARGHRVVVVDPSLDALASLDRRAREQGVADRLVGRQGDLDQLTALVGPDAADLVLCHGVLEVSGEPALAVRAIADVLRPGGVASLVVAQRHAAVIARAMAGQFQTALDLLAGADDQRAGRRFEEAELRALLQGAGLEPPEVRGVRVFADLVPGSLVDIEPGSAQALADLERAASTRAELRPLATQLHLLTRRPDGVPSA